MWIGLEDTKEVFLLSLGVIMVLKLRNANIFGEMYR